MKHKILALFLILLLVVSGVTACGSAQDRETLTQVSTIDAILNGVYDGVISCGELVEYGDFGIGTFEGLDGEMVVLDGKVYQVKADGVAYLVDSSVMTPFASVTYFDSDKQIALSGENLTYAQIQTLINDSLPTENIFCAIKITGTFSYMKTRSVPGQQKPYPPLVEVTKNQPVFEFTEVTGTIVGFFCPTYVDGVNVVGYHLHFINTAENAGGHILDFTIISGDISIDYTPVFTMILPGMDSDFYDLDLTPDLSGQLEQAEK
ncbi:MAG: acetolactate decarboxylase [Dehalococcoidales bacterium]|nr:acetolactate decarboxylase [Dehalococcoidales bacterium]